MAKNRFEGKSFSVDKDDLIKEWSDQPDFFHHYMVKLADARLAVEEAKAELDVKRAEIAKDMRENPKDYGLEKTTNEVVNDAVVTQPKYQKFLKKLNEAKHHQDMMQAAVSALEHRKKSLESHVYLFGANYYSTPQARGDQGESMREAQKKSIRSKTHKTRHGEFKEDD